MNREQWPQAAFLKLARLGAIVLLPTRGGKYLMQRADAHDESEEGKLRPPGGGKSTKDQNLTATITRELQEEFDLSKKDIRENLRFLGFEYRDAYWGNAVFELKDHGLKPGMYQASNDPKEKIELVEAGLNHPDYVGPDPSRLITEEAKLYGDKLDKKAKSDHRQVTVYLHSPSSETTRKVVLDLADRETPEQAGVRAAEQQAKIKVDETAVERMPKLDREHWQVKVLLPEDKTAAEQPEFKPDLTPAEMEELAETQARLHFKSRPQLASMTVWPDHWTTSDHPEGWVGWYRDYHAGRRGPGDDQQIRRWAAFKARHGAAFKAHPTPRRAWALVNWAIDPLTLLDAEQRQEMTQQMQDYKQRVDDREKQDPAKAAATSEEWLEDMARLFPEVRAGFVPVQQQAEFCDEPWLPDMVKEAAAQEGVAPAVPIDPTRTGPEALRAALANVNLDQLEEDARLVVKRRLKSKRPAATKLLGYIEGMRRAGYRPEELMLTKVPVIPTQFRPFSVVGDAFSPGSANELYRDLLNTIQLHRELEGKLGAAGVAKNRLNVYDAVSALYGFSEPTVTKTRERGISGFLRQVVGVSPKFSWPQRVLTSKDQDYVGRGVIGVDPELGMDEIGLPESMIWTLYAPYVQRRLVRSGMTPAESLLAVRDRTDMAKRHLDIEMGSRPVVYSRAPSWHKFNVISGYPKMNSGYIIRLNPLVTTGLAADHDGDSGRFYLMIHNSLDVREAATQAGAVMLKQDTSLRTNTSVIHIQNMPHIPETAVVRRPGVTEYLVPPGVKVYALDRETRKHQWASVSTFSVHENLEMWQVVLSNGKTICASSDHSLVIYKNGELVTAPPKESLWHCVPRVQHFARHTEEVSSVLAQGVEGKAHRPVEFNMPLTRDTGLWLGLLIGDGCVSVTGQMMLYGTGDKAVNREVFDRIGHSPDLPYLGRSCEVEFTTASLGGGEGLRQRTTLCDQRWFSYWIKQHIGDGALNKRIPDFSLNAPEAHLWGILDGLISTDGSISLNQGKTRKKPQLLVSFSTSSLDLANGVQVLLERLKLRSSITCYRSRVSGRDAYLVSLSTVDLARQHATKPITFNHPGKNAIFQEHIQAVTLGGASSNRDQVPYPDHLHDLFQQQFAVRNGWGKKANGKTDFGNFAACKSQCRWDRTVAFREVKLLREEGVWNDQLQAYLELLEDRSVGWECIVETHKLEERMTGWDITVPGAFTFALDDGVIVQDTINVHLPSLPEAVDDAKNKIMPSKMLFSIKDRDTVVPVPKQEYLLGLYQAQNRPARRQHQFPDQASALSAIRSGQVSMSDDVQIGPATGNPGKV